MRAVLHTSFLSTLLLCSCGPAAVTPGTKLSAVTPAQRAVIDKQAIALGKTQLLECLKSPSTAKFPTEPTVSDKPDHADPNNSLIEVGLTVDAANAMNAVLREKYEAVIVYDTATAGLVFRSILKDRIVVRASPEWQAVMDASAKKDDEDFMRQLKAAAGKQ